MDHRPHSAPVSPLSAGLHGRCPRCGEGPLFRGFLTTPERCSSCDLDYGFADAGDGPAVFIILIVGFIVVGLALWVEASFRPAYWVHAVLWLPLGTLLPLALLRPAKGVFLCQQYAQQAREGALGEDD